MILSVRKVLYNIFLMLPLVPGPDRSESIYQTESKEEAWSISLFVFAWTPSLPPRRPAARLTWKIIQMHKIELNKIEISVDVNKCINVTFSYYLVT